MINSRDKGNRHEYHVRDILKQYGFEARRSPLSGGIKGFGLEADIISNFPYFVECKNTESAMFLKWWKKAQNESPVKPACIVWTKNNEDIYVFLRFADLLDIMKKGIVTKSKRINDHKRFSLEETSGLQFSKSKMLGKKNKT